MKKSNIAILAGLSLSANVAVAAPVFTVDPTVIGNSNLVAAGFADSPFQSNFMQGTSSSFYTLIDEDSGFQTGTGFLQITGFNDPDGGALNITESGLGFTYSLWAEYTIESVIQSGTFGVAGKVLDITALDYTLYAAANDNTGLSTVQFTAANGNTPSVVHGPNTQIIGFGSLISGDGGAGLNAQGGSYFNAVVGYENTTFGNTFFTYPFPFYDIAFTNFNNTAQGVSTGVDSEGRQTLSLNSSNGGIDLNHSPTVVTEPGIIPLMSLGIFLMGLLGRRS